MKTKEELNALKEEVEALNKKLAELTEEELDQVVGGKAQCAVYAYACCDGGNIPQPETSPLLVSSPYGCDFENEDMFG